MAPRWALGLLLAATLAACGPKKAPPTLPLEQDHRSDTISVDVELVEYEVAGTSTTELRAEMTRLGPRDDDGNTYDGYAKWDVSWKYGFDRNSGGCAPSSPKVTVALYYTMPQAATGQEWSTNLSDRWERFIEALWEHELGHGEIAITYGERIQEGIEDLDESESCDELRTVVSELGHGLLSELSQAQRDYDAETNHGKRDGAHFP